MSCIKLTFANNAFVIFSEIRSKSNDFIKYKSNIIFKFRLLDLDLTTKKCCMNRLKFGYRQKTIDLNSEKDTMTMHDHDAMTVRMMCYGHSGY